VNGTPTPQDRASGIAAAFHAMAEVFTAHPKLGGFHTYLAPVDLIYLRDTDEVDFLVSAAAAGGFVVTLQHREIFFTHDHLVFRAVTATHTMTEAQVRAAVHNALHLPDVVVDYSGSDADGYLAHCPDCQSGYSTATHEDVERWANAHDCDDPRITDPEDAHTEALDQVVTTTRLDALTPGLRDDIAVYGDDPQELLDRILTRLRANPTAFTHPDDLVTP
jgi:hypothetical protein